MALGSRYKVSFRRRREGKTDYKARLNFIDIDKSRLVVRLSNKHIIAQIINVAKMGDETLVSAHSKELEKKGWLGGTKNTAAAYLTGYLCAKKALGLGIEEAVLDIGLSPSIKGSRVYAALKGASDAGLIIPHGENVLPDDSRIRGEHIAEYAQGMDEDELKQKFSQYSDKGLSPSDLPKHFDEIKNKIDETEV